MANLEAALSEQENTPQNSPEAPAPESLPFPVPGTVEVPNVGHVPVDELVKGYLRQQDYTRKTQEVAQDREKLQLAEQFLSSLEEDPKTTLLALAEEYELDFGAQTNSRTPATPELETEPEGDLSATRVPDELKQELDEVRQFVTEARERQLQEQIQTEIREAKEKYGDFPEAEVLMFAVQKGIPDIEVALGAWAFQNNVQLEEGVRQGLQTAQAREEATVEGASHGAPGVAEVKTFEDAAELALRLTAGRNR